ncbi:MAG: hypothetical protein U1E49_20360 [Hyphomicrobiaceae bacterium]
MARYQPPQQSAAMQFVDIVFLVIAIFVALWLPLKMGLAGAAKEDLPVIENATWEQLGQTPAQAAQWEKLGYAASCPANPPEGSPACVNAQDIIQKRFNYTIDWLSLAVMTAVLLGYFLFLFKMSDREYREVIAEKFDGKS